MPKSASPEEASGPSVNGLILTLLGKWPLIFRGAALQRRQDVRLSNRTRNTADDRGRQIAFLELQDLFLHRVRPLARAVIARAPYRAMMTPTKKAIKEMPQFPCARERSRVRLGRCGCAELCDSRYRMTWAFRRRCPLCKEQRFGRSHRHGFVGTSHQHFGCAVSL